MAANQTATDADALALLRDMMAYAEVFVDAGSDEVKGTHLDADVIAEARQFKVGLASYLQGLVNELAQHSTKDARRMARLIASIL